MDWLAEYPHTRTERDRRLAELGAELVNEHDVRLDAIMWDADEVLWDFVMEPSSFLPPSRDRFLGRDFGHREWIAAKPGIFPLLWGMSLASRLRDQDPYMRVWTHGYAWRMKELSRNLPALATLLGIDEPDSLASWEACPRLFCRADFARAVEPLLLAEDPAELLEHASEKARMVIERSLRKNPLDARLKIPDLAPLAGKAGFEYVRVLIDDSPGNTWRFARSGRVAIHVQNERPSILFGKIPNTAWRNHRAVLAEINRSHSFHIARALETSFEDAEDETYFSIRPDTDYHEPTEAFAFEVDDHSLRSGWVQPIEDLKRTIEALRQETTPWWASESKKRRLRDPFLW